AALGWHGVLGSAGIASAPLMASAIFTGSSVGWRQYYLLLTLPAVLLSVVIAFTIRERPDLSQESQFVVRSDTVDWRRYLTLVSAGALFGFIYAAFMHFLPRYLDQVGWTLSGVSPQSMRNLLAAFVLLFAIVGQAFAGRVARPQRLVNMLTLIMLGNAPILIWVALAEGPSRFWAMCTLAFVHFMSQPVYNSLIASYIPASRRSVGYGFSNMACFGFGALGPAFAGYMPNDVWTYGGLAALALLAGCLTLMLRQPDDHGH
ncbi:MAG: MFS transporter, partial [Planctomycetaceae bacterium]